MNNLKDSYKLITCVLCESDEEKRTACREEIEGSREERQVLREGEWEGA